MTIQSPGYPAYYMINPAYNYYSNNIQCEWTVTPSAMRRVLVEFLFFKLDHGQDILYVGTIQNPRVLTYSGYPGYETPDATIISPINESLQFEFSSDLSITDQGFSLLVTDVEDGEYTLCQNGLEIIRESFNCYDCPNKATTLSLNESIIIQSPGYPAYYQNDIQCEWRVTPSAMRRILVQFLFFKLDDGYDILYVGTIQNPRVLTYSGYPGYDTSDVSFISPINESLQFEFTSSIIITDRGFSILVTDAEDGDYNLCQNGLEIIRDSFNCKDCPNEETQLSLDQSVSIESPGYPAYYTNNLRCEWTVTPSATRRVLVQFLDFNIENGYDNFYVGTINKPRALTYSGDDTPDARIISPINESLVFEFTTDDVGTYRGFSLLVTDVPNGEYALCKTALEIIQESFRCNDCPNEETQLSTNSTVTIQSPSYPAYYQNNILCKWTITPTLTRRVQVQFTDFKLENGYDFLYIRTINESKALSYTGRLGFEMIVARIISPISESLLFEFTSDGYGKRQGFSLLVTDVEDKAYPLCENGLEIFQESFNCYDCPKEETQLSFNSSVTIQSPGYPAIYRNNFRCEWTVTPSAMRRVLVEFLFIELQHGHDILYVGTINNAMFLVYSGFLGYDTSDATVLSSINESLQFEFISDDSMTYKGFSLLVTDVEDGDYDLCENGLEIISESFNCYDCPNEETRLSLNDSIIINSPGYPAHYRNNIRCEWTVTPSPMSRVLVHVLVFKLKTIHDILHVGTTSNRRTLTYNGDDTSDSRFISPINESLVFEFTTDSGRTDEGFSLLVTDVADGDYARCKTVLEIIQESSHCYACPNEENQLSFNSSVTIQSPGYPADYHNNMMCMWTVTPSALRRVLVQFLFFKLEPVNDILYVGAIHNPRVLIYSGYPGRGTSDAHIISHINESLIFEFTSDDILTYQGFSLLVTDAEDGDYDLCQNGLEIISESFNCYDCPNEETKLSLNTSSVIIQSPGYPAYYQNNIRCEWTVTPIPMRRVLVRFLDFQLFYGDDVLYVGSINNPKALRYDGYETPGTRIISPISTALLFEFTSDGFGIDRGFTLLVTDAEDGDYVLCKNSYDNITCYESFGETNFICDDNMTSIPSYWRCNDEVDCADGTDETHCTEWQCPTNWGYYNRRCYLQRAEPTEGHDARDVCLQMDADLVVINDEAENAFVTTLLPSNQVVGQEAVFWIGLMSSTIEPDEYVWVDGTVARNGDGDDVAYT
ncbi:CUB and sushi domain-containing protein 3-like [Amphiura filiformis]|uniref:CUB and sushi domain-containing protein 3-like n=1 Tax=Amphiura filiformis TaxID=82378 RepID=UPI003B2109D1